MSLINLLQNSNNMGEKERIKETLQFVEDVFTIAKSSEEEKWSKLISLADEYAKDAKKIKDKYPYHVNPIEELHANENANSRILCAMLRYQVDGEFKILKSFVRRFFPEAAISIGDKPTIEPEQYRIDLSVREKGKYALIFENKIHDAALQKNQLARYIDKLHSSEGFEYAQIYVVFLPSSNDYETNDCCWHKPIECCNNCSGECKLKDKEPELRKEFEEAGRYVKVTFREHILCWLKDDVLPNVLYKETLLQSAVILYIDYLEGLFNLRTTDKDMVMELEQIIIEKLGLEGKNVLEQVDVLDTKLQNIEELSNTIVSYKQRILSETLPTKIKEIGNRISGWECTLGEQKQDRYFSLGFKQQDWELYIIIECWTNNKCFMYIGLHNEQHLPNEYNSKKEQFIFNQRSEFPNHPYGWKWIEKYNNNMKLLMEDIINNNGEAFENFIKKQLSEILKKIVDNDIKMRPDA